MESFWKATLSSSITGKPHNAEPLAAKSASLCLEPNKSIMMIDLRSDIVTRPSPAMRAAIAAAPVGEDLYREDPTVEALESRIAEALGKEAAVFMPTATMANLVAMWLLGKPGEEVIVEAQSHIYGGEMAGISAVCGLLARPIQGSSSGMLPWDRIRKIQRVLGPSRARSAVVCFENTHNSAGGTVLDQAELNDCCVRARNSGLRIHLDGSRLFNASVATRTPLAVLAQPFDTVTVCFSKGLGAPAGAVLACDQTSSEEARRTRKMFGGSIHQPGILAAACLYALDHNCTRLSQDHCRAERLAAALTSTPWASLTKCAPTNIVIFEPVFPRTGSEIAEAFRCAGVLVNLLDDGRVRLVTHLDLTDDMINRAVEVIHSLYAD